MSVFRHKHRSRQDLIFLWISVAMILAAVFISFCTALYLEQVYAPDEFMRLQLSRWIFEHNALPWGDEVELRSNWGFNYSFTPYFPNLVSVLFMKLAAWTNNSIVTVHTAFRLPSVMSIALIGIFAYLIARRVFHHLGARLCTVAYSLFLPQLLYLGGYFNNDVFCLFLAYGILFCWIYGSQEGWKWNCVIGFAVLLGMMTITYYFGYAFILCSILYFIPTCWHQEKIKKVFWIKTGTIITIAFLIGGWFFIKNAIFLPWDFFGMKAAELYKLMYAYGDALYLNPPAESMSLWEMLWTYNFPYNWFFLSLRSFFGQFQTFNDIILSKKQNIVMMAFWVPPVMTGVVLSIKAFFVPGWQKKLFNACLWICMITPVLLSIYNSYTSDYQPQGRYIITILAPLALMIAAGWQTIQEWFNNAFKKITGIQFQFPLAAAAAITYAVFASRAYILLNYKEVFIHVFH